MNDSERKRIIELKSAGKSIRGISSSLNIPRSTVGNYIKSLERGSFCKCCGKPISITRGHRAKVFCSDACRYKHWKSNNGSEGRVMGYAAECLRCHREFYSYRSQKRKFCSRACYDLYRKGGGDDGSE